MQNIELTGDAIAFVLKKNDDGSVTFDIFPNGEESTWEVGEAMAYLGNGIRRFAEEKS